MLQLKKWSDSSGFTIKLRPNKQKKLQKHPRRTPYCVNALPPYSYKKTSLMSKNILKTTCFDINFDTLKQLNSRILIFSSIHASLCAQTTKSMLLRIFQKKLNKNIFKINIFF